MDLTHVNKEIQKGTARVNELRNEAKTQRRMADQRYKEGNPDGARYYEQQADRIEQQGDELENEIDQLQAIKTRLEIRLGELEQQRATIGSSNPDHRARIDDEIIRIRGSSMML